MDNLIRYQQLLSEALASKKYGTSPKELYDPVDYIMSLGGKRMRPILVLMACELFEGKIEKALHAAVAIELFHNFTLVHDDIMDNAPLRRNQTTVHEKWDTNIAILSGDVMMVESYKEFCQLDKEVLPGVLDVFNDTAKKVCEGQQMDMNYETMSSVSLAEYLEMIELKTAVLLGGSLEIGALIANTSKENATFLYDFGKNMGIAFQLQDDILDVYGDIEKVGKQQGGDIISNKKTYMLLMALELSADDESLGIELRGWVTAETFNNKEKVESVRAIFDQLKVKEIAKKAMYGYYDTAISILNEIPVKEERKEDLIALSASIMKREY